MLHVNVVIHLFLENLVISIFRAAYIFLSLFKAIFLPFIMLDNISKTLYRLLGFSINYPFGKYIDVESVFVFLDGVLS